MFDLVPVKPSPQCRPLPSSAIASAFFVVFTQMKPTVLYAKPQASMSLSAPGWLGHTAHGRNTQSVGRQLLDERGHAQDSFERPRLIISLG